MYKDPARWSPICWASQASCVCFHFPLARERMVWFCKRRLRAFASLLTALSLSDVSDSQNIAPQLQAHGFRECLHRKPLISLRKRGAQSRDFNIFHFSQGKPEHGCCCQGNHLLPPRVLCIRVSLHLSALQGNIIALCLGKGF